MNDWLKKVLRCLLPLITAIALQAPMLDAFADSSGKLIRLGSHSLYLDRLGPSNSTPVVLFESGGGGTSKDWSAVREALPSSVQTCAYDRAGSGLSEAGPAPRTMRQEVFELHALLQAAKISGPIILVGHSIGGLLVRLYAEQYGSNVVGVVLVDPTHESSMLGSMRYGGWVRLREKALGKAIPEPQLSSEKAAGTDDADTDFTAEEFQRIFLQRKANPQPLGDRPLIVLGAGKRTKPPGTPDELWAQLKKEKEEQIKDLGTLSRNSKVVIDPSSSHAMYRDNPRLIAQAIEEVLRSARTGARLLP